MKKLLLVVLVPLCCAASMIAKDIGIGRKSGNTNLKVINRYAQPIFVRVKRAWPSAVEGDEVKYVHNNGILIPAGYSGYFYSDGKIPGPLEWQVLGDEYKYASTHFFKSGGKTGQAAGAVWTISIHPTNSRGSMSGDKLSPGVQLQFSSPEYWYGPHTWMKYEKWPVGGKSMRNRGKEVWNVFRERGVIK